MLLCVMDGFEVGPADFVGGRVGSELGEEVGGVVAMTSKG